MPDQERKTFSIVGLVALCIVGAIGIISVITLFSSPYIGIDFDWDPQGGRIISIDRNGPAGKQADLTDAVVVEIEGFPIWPYDLVNDLNRVSDKASYQHWWKAHQTLAPKIQIGKPLRLTVLKGGQPTEIQIVPTSTPLFPTLFHVIPFLFSGLLSPLIGLLVILKKGNDPRVRVFFVTTLAGSLIFFPGLVVLANSGGIDPILLSFFLE